MHGLIEIGAKLVHEEDHGGTDTTENPHDEKGEHTRCAKGKCLFPMWPVERVVDIIRRLRNKNDVRVQFLLVPMCMGVYV